MRVRIFFSAWMLIGTAYSLQQIDENRLRDLLTDSEWTSVMGTANFDIKNFGITHPVLIASADTKSNFGRRLRIHTPKLMKTFELDLLPSPPLLSADFLMLETFSNNSNVLKHDSDDANCYFRTETAALSLCQGIRGIIHHDDEEIFLIHPLPQRFQQETSKPHLVLKKKINKLAKKGHGDNCPHDKEEDVKYIHRKKKRKKLGKESSIKKSDTKDEDREQFHGDGTNTNLNAESGERKINETSFKDQFFNTYNGNEINSKNANVKNGTSLKKQEVLVENKLYLKNRKTNEFNFKNRKTNEFNLKNWKDLSNYDANDFQEGKSNLKLNKIRKKREVYPPESPVFVETAVFVDRDLFEHMKTNFPVDTERELIRFVLAMINAVQLLYHDPSLGRPVNFLLKRLEILKEEAPGLSRPPDIDRYLSNFCNWQRTKNPVGDREPQHWDHALILTGLDLYVRGKHGKISSQVVGLAPVAGMCTATSSCTVNEGRHFESVYVVAHEIGHNLGMRHDGPLADNDCDPSSYIMSPTLGSGKITWSSCSRRYLQKFLDTPQSRCLLDHGSSAGQLDHRAEGALPGERFDSDQQCMLKYGRGSRHSSQQPLDDVCRDLHCERERYTWTSHPALEGTLCGHNLWCRGGRCVIKGLSITAAYSLAQTSSARLESIDGGWSKWRSFSDCASGCLFGEEGRLRSGSTGIMVSTRMCNNPRPQGAGSSCDGVDRKYQSCHAQQCLNVPRLTIREFADQICTRAKEVDKDLTGTGIHRVSSDPEEACVVWCQKRNGGTKSRGWTFPDGTVCQTRRGKYGKASYCINGRCEDFVCDPYDEAQFAQMPDLCPNDRDDNEIIYRTGLRRRDSNVHWVSASGCHFNCISPGIGIRLVVNKAKKGRSSIQLCQPDKYGCGRIKSIFQHASIVCSKYKERVRRLSGLGMQISPALEDPDRPCRVACQDDGISHRFYLVNGEEGWFPFGTDCSRGLSDKKAYCVNGKCLEFGLDDTPVSQSEFTLPLLSRNKRSLHKNSTRVTAILGQDDLDEIITKLNETILGKLRPQNHKKIDIDLSNPIHVNMDTDMDPMPHKYYRVHNIDYYNYT